MKFKIIIVFIILLIVANSFAELNVKQYLQDKDSKTTLIYLSGLAEGLRWANADIKRANLPPLFCVPKKHVLRIENYQNILDRKIEELRESKLFDEDKLLVGPVLLKGLKDTFPCEE